jgi:hypothetical protein
MADPTPPPLSLTLDDPNSTLPSADIASLSQTGIPSSSAIGTNLQEWIEQEQAASEARGSNTFSGFRLPSADMGTFMGMIANVETYMANVGYNVKYMPTPVMMQYAIENGLSGNSIALNTYFAQATGAEATQPWAAYGMNSTSYTNAMDSINQAVFETTGQANWSAAGFDPTALGYALVNGWGTTQLQNMIQQNPSLAGQYNWAQYGVSYQQLQSAKATNHAALASQFGGNYTDQQAASSLYVNPLQQFGASGNAVTQANGPSSSGSSGTTNTQSGQLGRSSAIR